MRLLHRSGWSVALGVATLIAACSLPAGLAEAAFPGRDGWLAVQPLKGSGIVLTKASGRGERRVCAEPVSGARLCSLTQPQWSPDGRVLVIHEIERVSGFQRTPFDVVVYPDGSCLACQSSPSALGADASFTSNPTLFTTGDRGGLTEYSVDGLPRRALITGAVSDPVWSSRGELAVVRGGWIWVGRPGKLHRIARGRAPSWSPDGSQIVFVRRGWLMIVQLRGRSLRRLVRGMAPAWSPDGTWIAFFGNRHRLSVVRASGGRVRRVGNVTGRTVDWQPLPAKPRLPCLLPPGSMVMASSDSAIVSIDRVNEAPREGLSAWAVMGCVRTDGRERLLGSALLGRSNYESEVGAEAAVAGRYAALVYVAFGAKYDLSAGSDVALFDLQTGAEIRNRGGEMVGCSEVSTACAIDRLVLGSDAVSAVHTTVRDSGCTCTVEQIQSSDRTGVHTLDSVTEADGSPPALTNLTLTGDTLAWQHNGTPRSAHLQP